MGKGFQKKKKQARQMQEQFAQLQEQMQNIEAEGQAGNGLVKLTLNGDYEMKSIQIKPECVDPEDIEGLESLIKAAHQDAMKKVRKEMPSMGGASGGGFPDLSSLGFGM